MAAPAQVRSFRRSLPIFFPSPSLKVSMCVSCVRKGCHQRVWECARETHSPWFKIHRAIQQLQRGRRALRREEGPGQQPGKQAIARQDQGRGGRLHVSHDPAAYWSVTRSKLRNFLLAGFLICVTPVSRWCFSDRTETMRSPWKEVQKVLLSRK